MFGFKSQHCHARSESRVNTSGPCLCCRVPRWVERQNPTFLDNNSAVSWNLNEGLKDRAFFEFSLSFFSSRGRGVYIKQGFHMCGGPPWRCILPGVNAVRISDESTRDVDGDSSMHATDRSGQGQEDACRKQ